MPINKIQKEYLTKRVNEIINEKLLTFKKDLKTQISKEDIYTLISSKKFKMLPIENVKNSWNTHVTDFIDISSLEKAIEKDVKKAKDYETLLKNKATLILDKAILGDVSLESALKELASL